MHPQTKIALVAKLVDAPDLGSGVAIRVGSSPIRRTETKEASLSSFFVLSILGFVWGARRIMLSFLCSCCGYLSAEIMGRKGGLMVWMPLFLPCKVVENVL